MEKKYPNNKMRKHKPSEKWWHRGYNLIHLLSKAITEIRKIFRSKVKQVNAEITETIEIDNADGSRIRKHRQMSLGYKREE